ncbi:MAG: 23S rRNA (guanosine(2251)-2'-O)-methyltransferase RlmB [Calditrichota bacterium]
MKSPRRPASGRKNDQYSSERKPPRTIETAKPGEKSGLFYLYGRKPILEALRLDLVHSLEISRRAHGQTVQLIERQAEQRRVPIERVEALPGEDGIPIQGVRALAKPPRLHHDLRRFVEQLPESPTPFLLMLDGITDPHNFGAILRTAEASAVSAVIVRERRQAPVSEVVVKTSAGGAYLVPIFEVVNLSQTLRWLAEDGFWTVVAAMDNSVQHSDYHWNGKTVLVLGAEGMGVSDLVRKSADVCVNIPMHGQIESLNVSVAAGILLFEAAKRRGLA